LPITQLIPLYCTNFQKNEAYKKRVKASFDSNITPLTFTKGVLVLCYDFSQETIGLGKLETLWKASYIINNFLHKGAYILSELDKTCLKNLINGLYLKKKITNKMLE